MHARSGKPGRAFTPMSLQEYPAQFANDDSIYEVVVARRALQPIAPLLREPDAPADTQF